MFFGYEIKGGIDKYPVPNLGVPNLGDYDENPSLLHGILHQSYILQTERGTQSLLHSRGSIRERLQSRVLLISKAYGRIWMYF